jgi:tetratricopeptide (TPR) repeat protein
MAQGGRTNLAVLLAIPIATLLSSCAGAQKAPPSEAEAPIPAPPQERQVEAPIAPGSSAPAPARTGRAPAAPRPARPPRQRVTPEAEQRARAQFAHALKLQGLGDQEGAAAVFEAVQRSGAELPWAGFNAGLLQERLGRADRAVAAYEATVHDFPNFAPAGQNLVRLWLRQGRPAEEVERELLGRLEQDDGVALRVGLAEVMLTAGKTVAAEEECKKALKIDEKNIPAMVALANAYAGRKRFELARMVLENARVVDEHDPAIWNRLGFIEMALGNRPQAIDDFKTAASLRPDYPEAHANYGAILADADDFAGAAQELELAIKYAPRSGGTWLTLGNAYRGLQAFEKAEAAYRKALEFDATLNDARFNLAVLYLDVARPGLPTLERLEQGLGWFDEFEKFGGQEPRVAAYRKDTLREVDREKKRLVREGKDRLRKETEAKKKAEEEAASAATAAAAAAATTAAPQGAVTPAPAAEQNGSPQAPTGPAGSKLQEGGDK